MTSSATLAFLHHAAAFVLFAAILVEFVLTKGELTITSARSLLRMDALYGMSAGVLLVVGFLRVFYTEKGSDYYFSSGTFVAKIVLFVVVGLLSVYPTVQFLGLRKSLGQNQSPTFEAEKLRTVRRIIHIELVLLFVIMLCAALMARGIGFIGSGAAA
jgi:putative membrane protein